MEKALSAFVAWGPGSFARQRYHCSHSLSWPSPRCGVGAVRQPFPLLHPFLGTKFQFPFHCCCLSLCAFISACLRSFIHSQTSVTESDEADVEPLPPLCGSVGKLVHLCVLVSFCFFSFMWLKRSLRKSWVPIHLCLSLPLPHFWESNGNTYLLSKLPTRLHYLLGVAFVLCFLRRQIFHIPHEARISCWHLSDQNSGRLLSHPR